MKAICSSLHAMRLAVGLLLAGAGSVFTAPALHAQDFSLTSSGYFNRQGVDVMAFDDIYPEGHQGGVSLLMHGHRVATNGDLRLEATPGQWQPVPRQLSRKAEKGTITTTLCYPDSSRHLTGFNPMIYPDLQLSYTVRVEAKGHGVEVTVDLDRPLPDYLAGKAGFNLELFPGALFGKPWIMDNESGIYPQQPNGPLATTAPNLLHSGQYHPDGTPLASLETLVGHGGYSPIVADDVIAAPYAVGRKFTSRPDDPYSKFTVESLTGDLQLYDGRMNHNNGWFVLRSTIAAGVTKGAVKWVITPNVVADWHYKPVVQTSQVGYLPGQKKQAIIETDPTTAPQAVVELLRIDAQEATVVKRVAPQEWGRFLRYRYLTMDFTDVTTPGLYQVRYGDSRSPVFRIDASVYDRGVWQPVLEYFLPVQMCHMRVAEKYRVWHDACHMDDAQMAPVGNHFDGYDQRDVPGRFEPNTDVPGLDRGGWHDAGDFDLRIESQAGECYILALAYEAFRPNIDATTIDQKHHLTEIHQPDGRNDLLQQVEHGALNIVGGYQSLGRLYRGVICRDLRQYVLLGDASAMTDGQKGSGDDRWVFTEQNPQRELSTAAQLAATSRVLRGFNDTLSARCLEIAAELYRVTPADNPMVLWAKLQAAAELYLATDEAAYLDLILAHQAVVVEDVDHTGWYLARLVKRLEGAKGKRERRFVAAFRQALMGYRSKLAEQTAATPYGVPYRPHIWGAGWDIQSFGFRHYFLASAFPDIFSPDPVYQALHFVLGCHPGSNQASFASGVGAQSATVGYGLNRADWSYIPGGVISGTALIRPDFPELLTFPFLWQQTEYVLGGGSSHYMFLVLAARQLAQQQ